MRKRHLAWLFVFVAFTGTAHAERSRFLREYAGEKESRRLESQKTAARYLDLLKSGLKSEKEAKDAIRELELFREQYEKERDSTKPKEIEDFARIVVPELRAQLQEIRKISDGQERKWTDAIKLVDGYQTSYDRYLRSQVAQADRASTAGLPSAPEPVVPPAKEATGKPLRMSDNFRSSVKLLEKTVEAREGKRTTATPEMPKIEEMERIANEKGLNPDVVARLFLNRARTAGEAGVRELRQTLLDTPKEQAPIVLEAISRLSDQSSFGESMLLLGPEVLAASRRFLSPQEKKSGPLSSRARQYAELVKELETAQKGTEGDRVIRFLQEALAKAPELKAKLAELEEIEQNFLNELKSPDPKLLNELSLKRERVLNEIGELEITVGEGRRKVRDIQDQLRDRVNQIIAERLMKAMRKLLHPDEDPNEKKEEEREGKKKDAKDTEAWQVLCQCPNLIPKLRAMCPTKLPGKGKSGAGGGGVGKPGGGSHNAGSAK